MGGVMAKTVYDGLESVWNKMADVFSSGDMEEISDAISESEMTPKQLENFNKFKEWRKEFHAEDIFSDRELANEKIELIVK
jgi:hypothetical protein